MGWIERNGEAVWVYEEEGVVEEGEDPELDANSCVIFAVQDLLQDGSWRPKAVVDHIRKNKGIRKEEVGMVEKHAPVNVHQRASITAHPSGNITIESERGRQKVRADEQIVVAYDLDGDRGHAKCIEAWEFERYAQEHPIRSIFTRKK